MRFFKKQPAVVVRPRSQHPISRRNIAPEALKVLYRLNEAGYKAYLVGGSVRDLLLGRQPEDFDISTDASPREIKRLFRNSFLVGRRFRLAHIVFGKQVVETSTFRRQPEAQEAGVVDEDAPGALYQASDNTFGTPEEDARRRDFTVNALFYDIKSFEIIDYVGGLPDLDNRILRSIGDPEIRFREDPVRMMRAVRLAARLDLTIERKAWRAIRKYRNEINLAAHSRVLEEIFRLFACSTAAKTFKMLWQSGLMEPLLPQLDRHINQHGKDKSPLWRYLSRLDQKERELGVAFDNGLHLALLIWPLFQSRVATGEQVESGGREQLQVAMECLAEFRDRFKPPKAVLYQAANLLADQQRLTVPPRSGRRLRGGRAQQLADAIRLAEICSPPGTEAERGATLAKWQALLPDTAAESGAKCEAAATAGRPPARRRPRRPRKGRQPATSQKLATKEG